MITFETVTTDGALPPDALRMWNEAANRIVAPVKVRPTSSAFAGSIRFAHLTGCEMMCIRSSAARIHLRARPGDLRVNLQVQVRGSSTNRCPRNGWTVSPGDVVLFDPNADMMLDVDGPNEALIVRLPRHLFDERRPLLENWVSVPLRGGSGPGALLSAFVRQAWDQLAQNPGEWTRELPATLLSMMDMAFPSASDIDRHPPRERLRQKILSFIDDHLCDPDLTVSSLASAVGVSARQVQLLLAERTTTPSRLIRQKRLESAAARLEREGAACSITSLAYELGFNDLGTFCRSFRREYHVSASEYRAGLRGPTCKPASRRSN